MKEFLKSHTVIAYHDPKLPTQVYVDESPVGLLHNSIQWSMKLERRHRFGDLSIIPVAHRLRRRKVIERWKESLCLLLGILENWTYLYGTKFMVVVYNKPLLALYSSHSRSLPMRVVRHK